MLLLLSLVAFPQGYDPNSTPPGAPIHVRDPHDLGNRLMRNHPGNASNRVAAINVTIIESTSGGHTMDGVWSSVVSGMGHTPTIAPQSTLNSNAFFAGTDLLIISSGVIGLSATAVTTIRQFMQTGKPVYIQGEYQSSYQTNIAFRDIINLTGGTFALGSTVAGDLIPCQILNAYATSPNAVPTIGYHWYGNTGSGCNNIEYFMRWSGNNLGFVYCPTNAAWGDMVQSTDQDWVQTSSSLPLMQNIITQLLSGNACSIVCGVPLGASALDLQAVAQPSGEVLLDWLVDGELPAGRFEILANDAVLHAFAIGETGDMHFQWLDPRFEGGVQRYAVRFVDLNGQLSLLGEAVIDLGERAPRLRVATEATGMRLWLNGSHDCDQLYLVDMAGRRMPIATAQLHSVEGQPISMLGHAPGVYCIEGQTRDMHPLRAKLVWMH